MTVGDVLRSASVLAPAVLKILCISSVTDCGRIVFQGAITAKLENQLDGAVRFAAVDDVGDRRVVEVDQHVLFCVVVEEFGDLLQCAFAAVDV